MSNFTGPVKSVVSRGVTSRLRRATWIPYRMPFRQTKMFFSKVRLNDDPSVIAPAKSKLHGFLDFKNVTFGYDRFSDPLIENFSLHVEPGKRIALVGSSGSGKSTLAKTGCRLVSSLGRRDPFRRPGADCPSPGCSSGNSVSLVDQEIYSSSKVTVSG